jgi:hypothetical protein
MKNTQPLTIIRYGLALVFLANSLTAFFAPNEFAELISNSFVGSILPFDAKYFVMFIGVNDALVALLLSVNVRWVSYWATIWIIGMLLVRGVSLDTLEEVGFLAMSFSLVMNNLQDKKESSDDGTPRMA